MGVIDNFDTSNNFWTMYPQMKFIDSFEELYKQDKTKEKQNSSQLMWAIALLLDRSKNNSFRNLPEEEKKIQLATYFLKDKDFNWESLKPQMDSYIKICLSQAERSLISWERKIKERDQFIDKTTYDDTTFDMLDKMLVNTSKIYQQYEAIKASLELEQDTDNKKQFVTEI